MPLKQRIKRPEPDLKLAKPQEEAKTEPGRARREPGAQKRFVAVIPERIHRQIRQLCFDRDIDMRDYFLELLKNAGVK